MKKVTVISTIALVMLVTLAAAVSAMSQSPTPPAIEQLRQDANDKVEITWNPLTNTPSFIRGHIPLSIIGMDSQAKPSTATIAFVNRYASLLGVKHASSELKVIQDKIDTLGMRHITLQQVYQGVEVYGGSMKVHLSADGQEVVALSSSFVPDIQLSDVQPRITGEHALIAARKALPNGILLSGPKLVVYPGRSKNPGTSAKLAWLVELRNDIFPARNVYVIDATTGSIIDVLSRLYDSWQPQDPGDSIAIKTFKTTAQSSCPPENRTPGRNVGRGSFKVVQRLGAPFEFTAAHFLIVWEPYEKTSACWNPLATTWRMPGSCNLNQAGVQHYLSQDMGVNTTVNTLNPRYSEATRNMRWLQAFDREVLRTALTTREVCSSQGYDSSLSTWEQQWDIQLHLDRKTYDARHNYTLPGTLARSEGQGPSGDRDIDDAHDFAGATYDYYWNTHGRDSYNNQGATLVSTANYGRSYQNAYWNGEQTVYGDYFPVKDVVAHEWTHAVTEHSANLEYRWQSGALNESFSDIFSSMVDRDDWLIGEDLPSHLLGGREAIRDLSNPPRFGQPDHTKDWVETCSDNEGVHTNSGITNKAYYNIATAIGKDKAERIFYRTLTFYLDYTSSLEDARAAALQSAQDLYGANSVEHNAVRDGFNAVGLDGQWSPQPNDCTCAATIALSDEEVYLDRVSALEVAATLYRVRDQLLSGTAAGKHYRKLYEQHTGRISWLLLNSELRTTGGQILKAVTPGLTHLMDGRGENDIVTQALVDDVLSYLQRLAEEDRAKGGGELANIIDRERIRIDWGQLVGMTYEEAWQYIQSRFVIHPFVIYLPVVLK